MKTLALLSLLLFQAAPQPPPLTGLRTTLRQLRDEFETNRATLGATPALATAKHQFRDWVESQLFDTSSDIDTRAFAETLHAAIRDADLLCHSCDENVLGYVDDVRVSRQGEFLIVVTSMGIACSYDDSAYAYVRQGQRWRRVWEHEQNTYTPQGYRPQAIHEIQLSVADRGGRRTLMVLGSSPLCRGSFANLYARAWRIAPDYQGEAVLDRAYLGYDNYPPILGRVAPDDVLIQFTADGFLSGDVHVAVRHFALDGPIARQIDPIAVLPRDFVLEWLDAPWEESGPRSESASLEAWHRQLRRPDSVGDFAEPTRRCTAGPDLWQVGTRLFEGPKRYYRVRWRDPFSFAMVAISETPYPDCTLSDNRGETYPSLLR
jgi:hypothetical protein